MKRILSSGLLSVRKMRKPIKTEQNSFTIASFLNISAPVIVEYYFMFVLSFLTDR